MNAKKGEETKLSAQDTELINVLKARGFTERAARIYVVLLHTGSRSATELANALRTNRMAIYRSAEHLTNAGLITVALGTPTRYTAAPIDFVIDTIINDRAREMETLQRMRDGLFDSAGHLDTNGGALAFQVVRDKAHAIAVAKQLIQHAKGRVTFVVGAEEVLLAHREGLVDVFRDAVRTLQTRGITDITPKNHSIIAKILKGAPSVELRHVACYSGLQYLTVDGKNSLVGIATDPYLAERAQLKGAFLYVMSPAFAQCLDATFAYLWNNATEATMRFDQLAGNT